MNNEVSLSAAREARIDRAIDRAVREMMQVDPPPGLRRRVLARLDDSSKRRDSYLPRYVFAVVALLVVVALSASEMWLRSEAPLPPKAPDISRLTAPPSRTPNPPNALSGPPANMARSKPIQLPGPSIRSGEMTQQRIRMPHVRNVFGNRPGEVSATTVNSGSREIVVPPLTIVPLSARPIAIEPLALPALPK